MIRNRSHAPARSLAAVAVLALVVAVGCADSNYAAVDEIPSPVRSAVQAAVDQGGRPAVVLGLRNPGGKHYYAYGTAAAGQEVPVDEETTFAIGSITKLFTAQLLVRQVQEGAVSLDTPVADLWGGLEDAREVRLWQLASHQAGLPREIPPAALQENDIEPLLALLARSDSGDHTARYSNAGMALLGATLARQGGTSLSELMAARVLSPMGLAATRHAPDVESLAHPHRVDEDISDQRPSTVPVAQGAGGLYSSARDLLAFADHLLDPRSQEEADAVDMVLGRSTGYPPLGWQVHEDGKLMVYYHGGDGNGYQGFIGLRPDNGVAVVLLTNSSADDALQDIARHLLDPGFPLPTFDHPSAISIDTEILHGYAGRYEIVEDPGGNTVELQVEDGRLLYVERQPDGALVRRSPLYAEGERRFLLREIPVTLSFSDGTPESALLTAGDQRFQLKLQGD